ncbi:iron/manganese superoxide dismutase-like protein [Halopolyspora algeriensis]|uniref:superoxide dismutase n=1 Tax=Halopolyspora algeriensis TaxID=1500506 RepID=A0A368VPG5_9ACTN|nr:Fe-Mn family superoxide dismutase [Halopolyspora algeriensis]RCW43619.1 iron/manganese superoxide dismutase-like protein [Halopolyspora algeriensis]
MRELISCLIVATKTDLSLNLSIATTSLLVFDIWEHAYYLQYKNAKADYVQQLWNVVNWDEVSRRFADARAGYNGLRLPQA